MRGPLLHLEGVGGLGLPVFLVGGGHLSSICHGCRYSAIHAGGRHYRQIHGIHFHHLYLSVSNGFVGNDHRERPAGGQQGLAVAEEAERIGKVLEVVAADDPVEGAVDPRSAHEIEEVRRVADEIEVKQEGDEVSLTPRSDTPRARAMWGLSRTLVDNMVTGVTEGYRKQLEIIGVGYRA